MVFSELKSSHGLFTCHAGLFPQWHILYAWLNMLKAQLIQQLYSQTLAWPPNCKLLNLQSRSNISILAAGMHNTCYWCHIMYIRYIIFKTCTHTVLCLFYLYSQMLLVVKSRRLKRQWMTYLQAQNPHLLPSPSKRKTSIIQELPVRLIEERYSLTGVSRIDNGIRRPSLRRTISF